MPTTITPVKPSPVLRLQNLPVEITNQMLRLWVSGFLQVWGKPLPALPDDATPEQISQRNDLITKQRDNAVSILAELGTSAGALLEQSDELVHFILPRLPAEKVEGVLMSQAELQSFVAYKPLTTTHDDGTVTLD